MVKISQAQATVGSIQGGIPPSRVNANPDYDDDDDLSLAALLWLVVLAMFTALFCLLSLLNFLHVDPLVFFWISPFAEPFRTRLQNNQHPLTEGSNCCRHSNLFNLHHQLEKSFCFYVSQLGDP